MKTKAELDINCILISSHGVMHLINQILSSIFVQTWLGAVICHILSIYAHGFEGTIPILKKLFPKQKETFYNWVDFLLLPPIGAVLATSLIDPKSFQSSLFAGLSWSGTLLAFLKRNTSDIVKPDE